MSDTYFGICATCSTTLNSRYHAFNRNIERLQYSPSSAPPQLRSCIVLHSEQLAHYCSPECAEAGASFVLEQLGIPLQITGNGPIEPCSKCGKPVNLTVPHVAYELMDLTEIRQPWLLSIQAHDSKTVARLCANCDDGLDCEILQARELELAV